MIHEKNIGVCWIAEDDNPSMWLDKYNDLVVKIKSSEIVFSKELLESRKKSLPIKSNNAFNLGRHHILPKSEFPELEKDERNIVLLPFKEHMDLHYFLWKHDKRYARQLWFGAVFGRKHRLWDFPGGDEEFLQLKQDLRKKKK